MLMLINGYVRLSKLGWISILIATVEKSRGYPTTSSAPLTLSILLLDALFVQLLCHQLCF